ncbi:MAG: helix-turn-helix transcriptional regulator [Lachnospiraceae bacterium]|nr:helix-turn-helix transcriptional regulator [Lachnospiraceae bacterium]
MGSDKKKINIEVGARLKQIRENRRCSQSEFACALGIGDEHYRKLENGSTSLTIEKIYILSEKYNVDPSFLIMGRRGEEFDFDTYITNCTKDQKNKLMARILEYMKSYFSG